MKSWGTGRALAWLCLSLAAGGAAAQETVAAEGNCPLLPASTGLHWEYRGTADTDFCRALRADDTEAFGLFIAAQSPFEPSRGKRAEAGSVDGKPMYWYRGELPNRPQVRVRETSIEVGNGKVAYLWLHAASDEQLKEVLAQTEGLRFPSARLSSNGK